MPKDILTIHREILEEERKKMIKDIQDNKPEIEREAMIKEFLQSVNGFNLKERSNIAWRIFWGKL